MILNNFSQFHCDIHRVYFSITKFSIKLNIFYVQYTSDIAKFIATDKVGNEEKLRSLSIKILLLPSKMKVYHKLI